MKKLHSVIIITLLLGMFSIPALACRPLATDDCGTVEVGKYGIETAFVGITSAGVAANGMVLSVKTGILKQADFGVELPYSFSDVAGFNDIILHAKYRLTGQDDEGISLRADVKLATADKDKGLGNGNTDVAIVGLSSFKLVQLPAHFNLGYVFAGGNTEPSFWQSSFALEYPLNDKLSAVSELAWNNSDTTINPVTILLGGYYTLTEAIAIDAAVTMGLTNSAPSNIITIGMSIGL